MSAQANDNLENGPFVVGVSSSALFDTKEGDAVFNSQGEEAFIKHQIDNEDLTLPAGPAMPVVKALLAANAAITNGPRIKLIILSHNNPAASVRIMRSAAAYDLPIKRASFVGNASLEHYLEAEKVNLFLSRNTDDVRHAIDKGIAAAKMTDCEVSIPIEDNQLRVGFDWDAVIADDESERLYREQGAAAHQANEKALEKVPLNPGPFEPVLRWLGELQRELVASGANFAVRTAIITARNEAAMARVVLTMRNWNVQVNETHYLGSDPKDRVQKAFRAHIFFDDQAKNLSNLIPGGHVLFGVANEPAAASMLAPTPPPKTKGGIRTPDIKIATAATNELESVTFISKKDFETRCRSIFRSYTPLSKNNKILDERFRVFLSENSDRSGTERSRILRGLEKYNLADITQHDPTLNRELHEIVLDKLNKIVTEAVAPIQQTFDY